MVGPDSFPEHSLPPTNGQSEIERNAWGKEGMDKAMAPDELECPGPAVPIVLFQVGRHHHRRTPADPSKPVMSTNICVGSRVKFGFNLNQRGLISLSCSGPRVRILLSGVNAGGWAGGLIPSTPAYRRVCA